ncbi:MULTISPECIES: hypothetical protein [unclassified Paenibacillus]|uniref:hypothetical protein n=1 Tax=unclassified Paenibacillus TaxID=185978 RepID=UPI002F420B62
MKKMRLWKSTVAALLLVSLILSACGKEAEQPTVSPSKEAGASSSPTEEVKKEKLVLNWFVSAPANTTLPDASKDFVLQTIQDKFNVDLKLTYMVAGGDYNTKLNTLLASTPPDMWVDRNADGGIKYAIDGLLADLTPFLSPETMPNYFKYWMTEELLERYQVQGAFYRAPIPYTKQGYRIFYIRQDWLDNLNLKIPTTYEEYVEVLKAFTFDDPDKNGKPDTYGFSTSGGGANLGWDWPELAKNGVKFPSYIEDNRFVDGTMSENMEAVLDDVTKLIDMKVVDPDWYLNKSPQHIEKAIQGKVGVVMGQTKEFAFDNAPTSIQYRTKQIHPQAEWRPFTMVGDIPLTNMAAPSAPFLFPKTVAEKNPERVERTIEILDWLASEEGYLLTHFGQEGKHYTMEGRTITLNSEAYQNDILNQGNFLQIWSFFTQPTLQPEVYDLTVIDPNETDRDREIVKFLLEQPLNPYIGAPLLPPQDFDVAAFRKRQNELFSQAIFDDKSGKNWPKYREELLTKYKAQELLDKYTEDLRAAGALK